MHGRDRDVQAPIERAQTDSAEHHARLGERLGHRPRSSIILERARERDVADAPESGRLSLAQRWRVDGVLHDLLAKIDHARHSHARAGNRAATAREADDRKERYTKRDLSHGATISPKRCGAAGAIRLV